MTEKNQWGQRRKEERKKKEQRKEGRERTEEKKKDSYLGENHYLRENPSPGHMLGSKCVSTCERQYIIDLP